MEATGTLRERPGRRKLNGSGWIRRPKRLAIYLRDGHSCAYCGRDLRSADPRQVTLDHLVPRCEGGSNHESNLITSCLMCNSSRGARAWREYAGEAGGAVERIERLLCTPLNLPLAKALVEGTAGDPVVEALR